MKSSAVFRQHFDRGGDVFLFAVVMPGKSQCRRSRSTVMRNFRTKPKTHQALLKMWRRCNFPAS